MYSFVGVIYWFIKKNAKIMFFSIYDFDFYRALAPIGAAQGNGLIYSVLLGYPLPIANC